MRMLKNAIDRCLVLKPYEPEAFRHVRLGVKRNCHANDFIVLREISIHFLFE